MKIETTNYVCSICGKRNVKLWRHDMYIGELICAECAEKRQYPNNKYDEVVWKKEGEEYIGRTTGNKLPLPEWKVDEKGRVPSYLGPGPEGEPERKTNKLVINCSSDDLPVRCMMVPAYPDEDGYFWGYTSIPEEVYKWWEELPTR